MNFLERTYKLLDEKGISRNKMLTDLCISKNSFVDWTKRGTVPNGDTLIKIARYLDISVDYLLGASEIRQSFKDDTQSSNVRNRIFDLVLQLNEDNYEKVLSYIKALLKEQGE